MKYMQHATKCQPRVLISIFIFFQSPLKHSITRKKNLNPKTHSMGTFFSVFFYLTCSTSLALSQAERNGTGRCAAAHALLKGGHQQRQRQRNNLTGLQNVYTQLMGQPAQ